MKYLALLFILLWLSGCSSLFYHPEKQYYYDPQILPKKPIEVSFYSKDKTFLTGWLFESDHPKSIIVHFHGNAGNISSHVWDFVQLNQRGYHYFIFDYRGYGKSGGTPTPKGLVDDGASAIEWVTRKYPDLPMIVVGQSLGGAVLLRALAKTPHHPDKIVIDSSFANYRTVARRIAAKSWLLWLFQPIAWLIVDNSESPDISLHETAGNKLVIHGNLDRIVPFASGQELFSGLKEPKTFWEIEGGQHTDFMVRDEGKHRDRFFRWLEGQEK